MSDTVVYRDNAPSIIYKDGETVIYRNPDTSIIETDGDTVVYKNPVTSIIESQGAIGPEGAQGIPGIGGDEEVVEDKRTDHVEISETVNHFYKGFAAPGSLESDAVWRIYRTVTTETGDEVDISDVHADGVATYTKVWNSRLSYVY